MSAQDKGAGHTPTPRTVAWFSCGDASAVACALALKERPDTMVVRILLDSEHPDNERFAEQCATWYGATITNIRSQKYADSWAVWEDRGYIAGIKGAPCTGALKKAVRFEFQRPDDRHIFGFTIEETKRAETFRRNNFELDLWFPLIELGLTKQDCHALVRAQGIELPIMYRLGFRNNNCIGCPKGGAGYWNMIRDHFPDQFNRMAALSRRLGAKLIKRGKQRVFLDQLQPNEGRRSVEPDISCSPLCEETEAALSASRGGK